VKEKKKTTKILPGFWEDFIIYLLKLPYLDNRLLHKLPKYSRVFRFLYFPLLGLYSNVLANKFLLWMIARLVVTLHFKTKSLVENGFGKAEHRS